jgi:hypothetical protein
MFFPSAAATLRAAWMTSSSISRVVRIRTSSHHDALMSTIRRDETVF